MVAAAEAASAPVMPRLARYMAAELVVWSAAAGHVVHYAVSALYFVVTQVRYMAGYKATTITVLDVKPFWDNLPWYVWHDIFRRPYQFGEWHYHWWVTARHDARGYLIGLVAGIIVTFLVSNPLTVLAVKPPRPGAVAAARRAVAAPFRVWNQAMTTLLRVPSRYQQRRTSGLQYLGLPLVVPLWSAPGLAAGIGLLNLFPALARAGVTTPGWAGQFSDYLSQGKWQVTVLGLLGSQLFAKYVSLKPAADAQRFFVERRITADWEQGRPLRPPRLRPPGYRLLYAYYRDNNITVPPHSPVMARVLLASIPAAVFLTGFGFWLLTWGPAAHAV